MQCKQYIVYDIQVCSKSTQRRAGEVPVKQLWIRFLTHKLLAELQEAADSAPAWQAAATQANAERLAAQLVEG